MLIGFQLRSIHVVAQHNSHVLLQVFEDKTEIFRRGTGMTTEVHIKKCRTHLPYLSRIVSCIASRLGMNNTEIKEAEYAVEQACLSSISAESNTQDDLIICFSASDSCMTVDITDPVLSEATYDTPRILDIDNTDSRTYDIDTIKSSTGKIIRIKSPGKLKMNPNMSNLSQLSGLETANVSG